MLPPLALLLFAVLLVLKHFLADGPLQSRYQLANKGQFLHLGGLLHALTHAALTAACLAACVFLYPGASVAPSLALSTIVLVCALEFTAHYAIDLGKCRIEKSGGWSEIAVSDSGEPLLVIKDKFFFYAFLADQMLHSLTYVALVFIVAERLT